MNDSLDEVIHVTLLGRLYSHRLATACDPTLSGIARYSVVKQYNDSGCHSGVHVNTHHRNFSFTIVVDFVHTKPRFNDRVVEIRNWHHGARLIKEASACLHQSLASQWRKH